MHRINRIGKGKRDAIRKTYPVYPVHPCSIVFRVNGGTPLSEDIVDDFSVHVGEATFDAVVIETEAVVLEA
jgi:hypothetical protein